MRNEQLPLTISLIGAGKLGRSLARLWYDHGLLSVMQVFTKSKLSADKAVEFIGTGTAHCEYSNLQATDILLIAVPDDQIYAVCEILRALPVDLDNTVIFHCSGVMSSSALALLAKKGASVASVHPIKSFANPESAIASFEGTFCGVEGDQAALDVLLPLFAELGGHCIVINPEKKALYHCAAVFANNYMVSLVESAQSLYQLSGIDRDQSMQLMAPMLRETCENLIKNGTRNSLTGPIARGDQQTVKKHLNALEGVDQEIVKLYQTLGRVALRLRHGDTTMDNEIHKLLSDKL